MTESIQDNGTSSEDNGFSLQDKQVIFEHLPFTDTAKAEAEYAVIQASRKLYDADIRCRKAPAGTTVAQLTRLENAKARAVEDWREAMRALRETDPA